MQFMNTFRTRFLWSVYQINDMGAKALPVNRQMQADISQSHNKLMASVMDMTVQKSLHSFFSGHLCHRIPASSAASEAWQTLLLCHSLYRKHLWHCSTLSCFLKPRLHISICAGRNSAAATAEASGACQSVRLHIADNLHLLLQSFLLSPSGVTRYTKLAALPLLYVYPLRDHQKSGFHQTPTLPLKHSLRNIHLPNHLFLPSRLKYFNCKTLKSPESRIGHGSRPFGPFGWPALRCCLLASYATFQISCNVSAQVPSLGFGGKY